MSNFLIVCGGTGGHLAPGIAIAEELQQRGHQACLLVSHKQVDTRLLQKYPHLKTHPIAGTYPSWRPLQLLRFFIGVWKAIIESKRILSHLRPVKVIGFGGFLTVVVAVISWIGGYQLVLHEANRRPGKAIRILAPFAHQLYLPVGITPPKWRIHPFRQIGLPIRSEIQRMAKEQARQSLGLKVEGKLLVVLGGSQGAQSLNQWMEESFSELALHNVQVYGVTGLNKSQSGYYRFPNKEGQLRTSRLVPFSDQISVLLSAADLVVARAGAGTLAELVRCQTPAILVPYPAATDQHQLENARFHERNGAGVLLEEKNLSILVNEVVALIENEALLHFFRTSLGNMNREDALQMMVDDLLSKEILPQERQKVPESV